MNSAPFPVLPILAYVVKAYDAAYPEPVELKTADMIKLRPHPDNYPGWIWGETESGKQRWFPAAFLDLSGECARLKRDYNSIELSVSGGETVNLLEIVAGWGWCALEDGSRGWLPMEVIDYTSNRA